ncbi:hypothetical protein GDO81_020712 [Engystomops pustulosus]|uniref:Uncharacterized protein n=1 Tax=Engystomops pustulosus TaxID=76066 RepID=A0AAV6ZKA2_ENGPU|nr:hypothetical protein GDO81_020712 [Engystomops pustulosus]
MALSRTSPIGPQITRAQSPAGPPIRSLTEHLHIHTDVYQELRWHLEHDHLVPDWVDFVLCPFALFPLEPLCLMPESDLHEEI